MGGNHLSGADTRQFTLPDLIVTAKLILFKFHVQCVHSHKVTTF